MSKRIGVVTGGGDCPGLNAVIRAVAKTSANRGWECINILGGYEGLLEPYRTKSLDYHTQRIVNTRRNDPRHGEPRKIFGESWARRESRVTKGIARGREHWHESSGCMCPRLH